MLRARTGEDLERQFRPEREIALATVTPAATARRPAAGTRRTSRNAGRRRRRARRWLTIRSSRRANGTNANRRSSASAPGLMQVDALHQQRPVARRQRLRSRRGETGRARATSARRRARRAAIRRRRARASAQSSRAVTGTRETGQRAADEQRVLLPEAAQERGGARCGRRGAAPICGRRHASDYSDARGRTVASARRLQPARTLPISPWSRR